MATKKYKIKNTNLLHNGHTYKIGDVIELDEKQAKKLEDVLTCIGNVETKSANKSTVKTKTETKSKTEKPADVNETKETETGNTEGENNDK